MVVDKARHEDNHYLIDEELFNLLASNQHMAEKAMKGFSKVERIMLNKIKTEMISLSKLYSLINKIRDDQKKNASVRNHTILINSLEGRSMRFKTAISKRFFQEAINELLINAMKFSDPDSIIEISFKTTEDLITISIINNPEVASKVRGIPEDYSDLVFEPFFRILNFVKEDYKTLDFGLGLTMVKDIILKHGGEISISNQFPDPGKTEIQDLRVICNITLPVES